MKKKRKRDVRPCVSAKEKNTRKFYDESFLEIFTNRKIVKSMLEDLKDAVSCFFLLDKTNLKERDKAAERIIRILKILKDADKETFNLLGRYITGLLKYKGVEINSINEYINDGGKSMLAQSLDELFEQGIEQGGLLDKQEVLIRQAEKKFGLSEEGRKLIKSVTDSRKLDDALDIILFAGNPEEVLNCLKY